MLIAKSLLGGPNTFYHHVGVEDVCPEVFGALETMLNMSDASMEAYSALVKEIVAVEASDAYPRAMEVDRCIRGLWAFRMLDKAPSKFFSHPWFGRDPGLGWVLYASPLGSPFRKMDEAFYLRMTERWIAASLHPYHEAIPEMRKVDTDLQDAPVYCLLTKYRLHPHAERSTRGRAGNAARIRAGQLAVALRMHRMRRGAYPDGLGELTPGVITRLPKDPFSGEDYHYQRRGDGFIVYSTGDNGGDDGGLFSSGRGLDGIAWTCVR